MESVYASFLILIIGALLTTEMAVAKCVNYHKVCLRKYSAVLLYCCQSYPKFKQSSPAGARYGVGFVNSVWFIF